jgi:CBS domain-containing protein
MKNFVKKDRTRPGFVPPRVTAYMVPAHRLVTFRLNTPIREVVTTMLTNRISGAPILNARGAVVGLIDDKDCLRILPDLAYCGHLLREATVEDYTTNVMKTVSATANVLEVAGVFLTTQYRRLLVVDGSGRLVGQVSRRDILRAIHDYQHRAKIATPLRRRQEAAVLSI